MVICHFAANQGHTTHTLELILKLLCLETVALGFKNSRQQRTTKALTGLFAEAKMGPFFMLSQITLPDPFSAILSLVPRKAGREDWGTAWLHYAALNVHADQGLVLKEQPRGWCFPYPVFIP